MNAKHVGPAALVATLIGLVGGGAYAANVAFRPVEKPAPVVNIAPAAETVTQTPTVAVVTPSTTATTVKPKPVKSVKVAVSSTPKVATTSAAPKTVQRQAIVSEQPAADPTTADPAPSTPKPPQPRRDPNTIPNGQRLTTATPPSPSPQPEGQ